MSSQKEGLVKYVPRTLRDDGMITAAEVAQGGPDGITCRDATIQLQDARIADLTRQLAESEKALKVAKYAMESISLEIYERHGGASHEMEWALTNGEESVQRIAGYLQDATNKEHP